MIDNSTIRVLAVPNLQGARFTFELENSQVDWIESANSLQQQVDILQREYSGQQLLIGSSFGGLASWRFTAEQSPTELKGLILLDVLPNLDAFPKHRQFTFGLLTRLPESIAQSMYHFYRTVQKNPPVDVLPVLERVRSIRCHFPDQNFHVPTLVISSNIHFHNEWEILSDGHSLLTTQRKTDCDIQIRQWVQHTFH